MNIDIKKITKTIIRKNRGLRDPQLIYPARDWAVGMMGTLVIISLAVAFSIWQYRSYTNLALDEKAVLDMISYRTVQVEQALIKYRDLASIHNEIISDTNINVAEEEDEAEEKKIGKEEEKPVDGTLIPTDSPNLIN